MFAAKTLDQEDKEGSTPGSTLTAQTGTDSKSSTTVSPITMIEHNARITVKKNLIVKAGL